MPNEPTAWELDRRFDRLDKSIETGFRHISSRLDKMVSTEVFSVSQRNVEQRLAGLEGSVSAVESRCNSACIHLQKEIDQTETKIERVEDLRANDRRTMFKAIATGAFTLTATVLGFILTLLTTAPGGPL